MREGCGRAGDGCRWQRTCTMKPRMTRWKATPRKCSGTCESLPRPRSPVQRARKFSEVRGTSRALSSMITRPTTCPPRDTSSQHVGSGPTHAGMPTWRQRGSGVAKVRKASERRVMVGDGGRWWVVVGDGRRWSEMVGDAHRLLVKLRRRLPPRRLVLGREHPTELRLAGTARGDSG